MRAELLERYRSLPLPTTRDEHWRFTNLEGFDPDAWTAETSPPPRCRRMLDLDVAAAATIDEVGISVSERGPPTASASSRSRDDHPLLGSLVKPDDKFRAHNAAVWQHGLLVHVPAGRRAREAALPARRERRPGRHRSSGASSSSPSPALASRSSRS